MLITLTGCFHKQETPIANVLIRSNGSEPQTLDPHLAEGVPASNILRDLYEGLMLTGPEGEPIAGAAKSYSMSSDGKIYTFYLRQDAKWSNGDPVLAQHFVDGFRRSLDPKTGSQYSLILACIKNAQAVIAAKKPPSALGVKALDSYTLQITLKAPTPYFLGLLSHSTSYPIHLKSLKQYGKEATKPGNLVSNGAYQLKEWVVQSHIVVEKNPNYWDSKNVSIPEVHFLGLEEASSVLKKYRAGELSIATGLGSAQLPWIKKYLPDELYTSPILATYYYGLNVTKAPFRDNVELRRALSLAIDRDIIVNQITKMGQIPAFSFVPPKVYGYKVQHPKEASFSQEERFVLAKKAYKKAGYSSKKPLKLEIRYNTSEDHKRIAVAIGAMWKEHLGIEVSLLNEEWKVFLKNRKEKTKTQVFRAGWVGDYNDANTFLELLHSKHGINDSGYTNPAYDALLSKAALEVDVSTRQALLALAEHMMISDYPIIPLYFYTQSALVKPFIKGYRQNSMGHIYSKDLSVEPSN